MSASSSTQRLAPASQDKLRQFVQTGFQQGCPKDQLLNFVRAGIALQPRQLAASAAARLCDQPDGPNRWLRRRAFSFCLPRRFLLGI